jgi:hypothetical protein
VGGTRVDGPSGCPGNRSVNTFGAGGNAFARGGQARFLSAPISRYAHPILTASLFVLPWSPTG